jgi:hypothetical protein
MTCCWLTGDPIANITLLQDPGKNLVVIMKDGKVYKKHGSVGSTSQKANRNISPLLLYGG